MFKSAEEREAERQQREVEQAREVAAQAERRRAEDADRQRQAYLASPVGAATAARAAGELFFELQLEVRTQQGQASFGGVTSSGSVTSSASVLAEIEAVGWHLEHASYYFAVTGQSSTERVFLSGENTAVTGVTVGAYLFQRSAAVARTATAAMDTPPMDGPAAV
ncbi:hypothetical protein [Pedococcus bigeumensis]|uniref:Uncharacterized protein n=1 Tax=Pedococcus bigeumensis TaxID=433644 RepID=A0A502CQ79_9MICO|nr:hypothetical protein [Pedococcus bigeumensis]TPG14834.1 hypothetical protein EAH86_14840 [Pedococcus bigeumensis]